MKNNLKLSISFLLFLPLSIQIQAQQLTAYERLPAEVLAVNPPSSRVSGEPGEMQIVDRSCSSLPRAEVRRRMVDIAVQEWAYFGLSVEDMTSINESELSPRDANGRRRYSRPGFEEAARVADSIAGYWSAAPDSSWILAKQNQNWQRDGLGARWRDFWSAAFVSWVACESGLGEMNEFSRAIAHHTYIDQAILARDGIGSSAAYIAFDVGEAEINPGDLLCRGSRPEYSNLEQRRGHLGEGARTHCDIVVAVDEAAGEIKAIGGNVKASVRLKIFPASKDIGDYFSPAPYAGRQIFAHLQLQADPIEENALNNSPTLQNLESLLSTIIPNRTLASRSSN
ncbi:MAG: hypothetical protein COA71_04630 [SAR86 cluster bacterium]|uniref:DUF2272 domain-containing protein n=1 Tax=SAR86 cluster bacterium TaxID=2030880 RepID=A0A2A5CG97_9GAMM|nr:MAG: hypothetical protein COA71_04630 [SAR86 cluster bacterium]